MAETRAEGVDPQEARHLEAEQERLAKLNTFELLARSWHGQTQKDRQWSAGYAEKVIRHLELHIFPWIGHLPMEAIKPTELVRCLHRIKERGNLETARRVRGGQGSCFAAVSAFVLCAWVFTMSTSARKLRLGPLPRHETVKLTISVPAALRVELDFYAAALIPHMLEAFIRSHRGYRVRRTSAKNARQNAATAVEHSPNQNRSG